MAFYRTGKKAAIVSSAFEYFTFRFEADSYRHFIYSLSANGVFSGSSAVTGGTTDSKSVILYKCTISINSSYSGSTVTSNVTITATQDCTLKLAYNTDGATTEERTLNNGDTYSFVSTGVTSSNMINIIVT